MLVEAGIGLGSNDGDRLAILREARARMRLIPGVEWVDQSPIYETEPVGVKPEHRDRLFLNAVGIVRAAPRARELHAALQRIEAALGRVRGEDRYAPRRIDLDVLYVGDLRIEEPSLTLPHPEWNKRRFVTQPLADVRPGLVLPGEAACALDVLRRLPNTPAVRLFQADW